MLQAACNRDGADLLDALDAYVAFLHLDPPRQWSEPAKENKLADGVVDELVAAKELTADEAEWYAGMTASKAAAALGLPTTPDERAAHILKKLTSSATTPAGKAVGKGVKRYTLQQRASKNPKPSRRLRSPCAPTPRDLLREELPACSLGADATIAAAGPWLRKLPA